MQPVPRHQWTLDHAQSNCTACQLPFTLCRRRHHCRWCGSLFCSPCTPHLIDAEDGTALRACVECFEKFERSVDRITVCPVCSVTLGERSAEQHLKQCCQETKGGAPRIVGSTFVVSVVRETGVPKGECDICMEVFVKGQSLAVLNCLCKFHEHCIAEWFGRGNCCPFHPD